MASVDETGLGFPLVATPLPRRPAGDLARRVLGGDAPSPAGGAPTVEGFGRRWRQGPAGRPAGGGRRDAYFHAQDAVIANLRACYVARPEMTDAFGVFIRSRSSGIFVIEGPAGSGKSAWMAWLSTWAAAAHLAARDAGRDAPLEMAQSLFSQVARTFGYPSEPPERREPLWREFGNLLAECSLCLTQESAAAEAAAVAAGTPSPPSGALLLLIDGVDELRLGDGDPLAFLPAVLPEHVYVVLSTRPFGPSLPVGAHWIIYPVAPLDYAQAAALIGAGGAAPSPALVARALTKSGGNPLFLRWYLAAHRRDPGAAADLEGSLVAYFGFALRGLAEGEESEAVFAVLALLAVAREPLSPAALAAALGCGRRKVGRLLGRMRIFVHRLDGGVALAHRTVADFLGDRENPDGLGQDELGRAHEALATVPLPGSTWGVSGDDEDLRRYVGRQGGYHLFVLGRISDLVTRVQTSDAEFASRVGTLLFEAAREGEGRPLDERLSQAVYQLGGTGHERALQAVFELVWSLLDYGFLAEARELRASLVTANPDLAWMAGFVELKEARVSGRLEQVVQVGQALLGQGFLAPEAAVLTHQHLAEGYREQGRHLEAVRHYEAALSGKDSAADPLTFLQLSGQLADLEYVHGLLSQARARLVTALDLARGRFVLAEGVIYRLQGQIEQVLDRHARAVDCFEASLAIAVRVGRPYGIAECFNSLGEAEIVVRPDQARASLREARVWAERCGARLEQGKSLVIEGALRLVQGDCSGAEALAREGLAILAAVGYGSGIARGRVVLAAALAEQERGSEAWESVSAALVYYQRDSTPVTTHRRTIDIQIRFERHRVLMPKSADTARFSYCI